MKSFPELAASRREWIQDILVPWCRQARYPDLIEAEQDWQNIAGRVDPAMTLWTWAWSRFPGLVHDAMPGLNETREVRVTLADGRMASGYPDSELSVRGDMVLVIRTENGFEQAGPFRIDEITGVELTGSDQSDEPPPRSTTLLPPETPPDVRI